MQDYIWNLIKNKKLSGIVNKSWREGSKTTATVGIGNSFLTRTECDCPKTNARNF